MEKKKMSVETACVHGTYRAKSGEPQHLPISQNTTYRYYNAKDVADLFNLESAGFMYSRLGNPTLHALEEKMALLEGGTAGVSASSGQSATLMTLLNICKAGDHVLSSASIYGGTYNLLSVTMKKMGIAVTFIDQSADIDAIVAQGRPETRAIFAESLANPALAVLDFEKFSKAANALGVPLIIDNTLATPALCRPIEHGADIVIQSMTKYADGHGSCVGGMVVEAGRFDWARDGKYPEMTEPDPSYHGLRFYETFGGAAFALKLRAQMLRDMGATMAPMNAYLIHQGLQTLHLRMERHSQNALALAGFLQKHPQVEWITYPGLAGDDNYALAAKYLPRGASGVLCFGVKGGREAGERFLENLELSSIVVHVGDVRTSVLHPASTTHRQLSDAEQLKAGIRPEMIRVSVGIEGIDDILADFDQALKKL